MSVKGQGLRGHLIGHNEQKIGLLCAHLNSFAEWYRLKAASAVNVFH